MWMLSSITWRRFRTTRRALLDLVLDAPLAYPSLRLSTFIIGAGQDRFRHGHWLTIGVTFWVRRDRAFCSL